MRKTHKIISFCADKQYSSILETLSKLKLKQTQYSSILVTLKLVIKGNISNNRVYIKIS